MSRGPAAGLIEEAPTAYERIGPVIGDLTGHGPATPIAATVPLVSGKTADVGDRRRRGRA